MSDKKSASFTLLELLVVIIIIGILSALGLAGFTKTKQNVLSKEAKSNIKLIAAAEKIYRMEDAGSSYGACSTAAICNTMLKLDLNTTNWLYKVELNGGVATITATLVGTPACTYTLSSANFNANPSPSGCPAGMD